MTSAQGYSGLRIPSGRSDSRHIIVVLLFVLTSVGGCAALGMGGFNLVSLDEEWQLGREIERDLNRQLTLVNDAQVQNYVREIGQRIVNQTNMAHLPWSFHVVRDPAVNAFNTPGGNVYVYTGLITAADNVAELAAVIAHEVGHGVARHGTQRLSQAYGMNVAAAILLGGDPGLVQQIAAQIAAQGAMAQFSQRDEREADRLGQRFMRDAGYNPLALATFFEKLAEQERRNPGAVGQFFSSHPMTSERIENARREASRLGTGGTTADGRLSAIQSRVR
jgi:beta-barrel assembly-enhancing protease